MEKPFQETWFYAPLHGPGEAAELNREESHHLLKVLRIPVGRQVVASNGLGGVFLCDTISSESGLVQLQALESLPILSPPPRVHVVLSLLKGKDLEEPVEGLCQLNIRAIHLVTTDHTQEFKGQTHERLVERLRGKSLVSLKQAKKSWLTEVHAPIPLREWRKKHSEIPCILLHPGEDVLPEIREGEFAIVSGPEGGFSRSEFQWLESNHFYRLGLGSTRLRATHAPQIACGKLMGLGWID